MNNVVCIPAYKPDHRLLDLVEALENVGLIRIVLADDGSGSEYTPVFCRAEEMGCTIVHHAHNMGKGAALVNATPSPFGNGGVLIQLRSLRPMHSPAAGKCFQPLPR